MAIRKATPHDLPRLNALLEQRTDASSPSGGQPPPASRSATEDTQKCHASEKIRYLLISELDDGRIDGMIKAEPLATRSLRGVKLGLLATSSDSFGRRLKSKLMQALIEELARENVAYLWLISEQENIPFYASLGAVELATVALPELPDSKGTTRLRLTWGTVDELATERMVLRRWSSEDLPRFAALNANLRVNEFLPGPLSSTKSNFLARKISYDLTRHGFGFWSVNLKADDHEPPHSGEYIGMVGLGPLVDLPVVSERIGRPCLEIAWRLLPRYWGQGLATEAACRCIAYAFEDLQVDELVAFTVPQNLASRRVMEKLGFQQDLGGSFEHPQLPKDHPLCHHLLYRRTRL